MNVKTVPYCETDILISQVNRSTSYPVCELVLQHITWLIFKSSDV